MLEVEATPLNYAANKGFVKIVDLLIESGANVSNQKKPDLRTVITTFQLISDLSAAFRRVAQRPPLCRKIAYRKRKSRLAVS
jgi:ankyrin repeat protein